MKKDPELTEVINYARAQRAFEIAAQKVDLITGMAPKETLERCSDCGPARMAARFEGVRQQSGIDSSAICEAVVALQEAAINLAAARARVPEDKRADIGEAISKLCSGHGKDCYCVGDCLAALDQPTIHQKSRS
ncbi:hypothetical protein [Leisingera caerulea]|uniref:hypothetical protein n=1 Tax=Leisingera caerulea TaxID=506591 RepID=UPI0004829682|nr:hypothetical protein [Leisingera caerulea]